MNCTSYYIFKKLTFYRQKLSAVFLFAFLLSYISLIPATVFAREVTQTYAPSQVTVVSKNSTHGTWLNQTKSLEKNLFSDASVSDFTADNSAHLFFDKINEDKKVDASPVVSQPEQSATTTESTHTEVATPAEIIPEQTIEGSATSTDNNIPLVEETASTTTNTITSDASTSPDQNQNTNSSDVSSSDSATSASESSEQIPVTPTEVPQQQVEQPAPSAEVVSVLKHPTLQSFAFAQFSIENTLGENPEITVPENSTPTNTSSSTETSLSDTSESQFSTLEYAAFIDSNVSDVSDLTQKESVLRMSLGALGEIKGTLHMQYAVGDKGWHDLQNIEISGERSNKLNGDYFSIPLPSDIGSVSDIKIRVFFEPVGDQGQTGSAFFIDGIWIESLYTTIGEDNVLDDTLLRTDESFEKINFDNSLFTLEFPADLSNPITLENKQSQSFPLSMVLKYARASTTAVRDGNRVVYHDALRATDIQYDIQDKSLKESIILNNKNHPERFTYVLNIDEYDFKQVAPNRIELYKKGRGGNPLFKVYTLTAPNMVDANGNESTDIVFELEGNELAVVPDHDWLRSAAYPVVVDPTVEISVLNIHSHPVAGQTWDVDFVTNGTAPLTITPADQETIDDMEFISLACGSELRQPEILPGDVIYYPNWSCDDVARITHNDLKTGHHHLVFTFGDATADAYNAAVSWDGGAGTSNWSDGANWSNDLVPGVSDDVVIASAVTVNIAASTTVQSLTLGVSGGGTASVLNFNYDAIGTAMPLTTTGNLTVYSGASITHTAGTSAVVGTVNLIVGGSAQITGSISGNGKGYALAQGPGAGTLAGRSVGGSYGGLGGTGATGINASSSVVYGSTTAPTDLGSGGASGFCSGGAGGGAIKLMVTGTTTVTGSITTTGNNGSCGDSGSGAGGSVYLITGTLAGAGTVSANGGINAGGGGGSGGRVAIYYTASSSTITSAAYGGTSATGRAGGAGTVFIKAASQTYGDLTINNNNVGTTVDTSFGLTPLIASSTFDTLNIKNSAGVYLATTSVAAVAVLITNNGLYDARATTTLNYSTLTWTGGMLWDSDGTIAVLNQNQDLTIPTGSKLTMNVATSSSAAVRTYNNVTINGTLTHADNLLATVASTSLYKLNWQINGGLTINSGGSINADSKGFARDQGPGSGTLAGQSVGGSYGGLGGTGATNISPSASLTYGSITAPFDIGSGGDTAFCAGGTAGGAIKLNVTGTTNVLGTISAIGANGACGDAGAGSGGSINITTATLSGNGTVSVVGGDMAGAGGSGGGGRVAMYYTTDSSTITYLIRGGTTSSATDSTLYAGSGTLYKKPSGQTYGDLVLNNGGTGTTNERLFNPTPIGLSTTDSLVFNSITATGSAAFYFSSSTASSITATATTVTLIGNGMYRATATSTLIYTTLNWTGGMITDAGGTLAVLSNNQDLTIPTGSKLISGIATSSSSVIHTYNNVTVNGTLTHGYNNLATTGTAALYKLNWQINGNLTVNAAGSVDVQGRGFLASYGPAAGFNNGSNQGVGASYGGLGNSGLSGGEASSTYGSLTQPTDLGSGGFNGNSCTSRDGGGAIIFNVTGATTISGTINANARSKDSAAFCNISGGSGGSIYLTTASLAGSGTVKAIGGDGHDNGGGGGGGRIAVYYTTDTSSLTYQVYGGAVGSLRFGGSGTFYKKGASQTYGDLTLDNNNQGGTTVANFGKTTVYTPFTFDNVTLKNSAYLNPTTTQVLNVKGNLTWVNATASSTWLTVQMSGTGAQTLTATGTLPVNIPIIINSTGTTTLAAALLASSTLTVTSGGFNANGTTTQVSGLVTVNGGTYAAGTSTQTFYSGLTISSGLLYGSSGNISVTGALNLTGGILTAPSGTLTVSGDFNHATGGVFSHNNGTVSLTGTSQTVYGTTTFYNLSKTATATSTLYFNASTLQTVANTLTLQGASNNPLNLRSTATGTQWRIDPQGSRTVGYLDVRDSYNTNATYINAVNTSSVDSGNNYNWAITNPTFSLSNFRFYENINSLQPTTPLAVQNATATIYSSASPIRLRLGVLVNNTQLFSGLSSFSLQAATSTSGPWNSASTNNPPWWNEQWQNRRKITFNNVASSENLVNFPVLVSLNATTTGNVDYSKIKADGADIRFVDADGTTALPYEIETWNTSTTSTVWVKVPQVNASSTTDYIWMYYNNPSATDGQQASSVWDSNYAMVLHMTGSGGTVERDSTARANNGTKTSSSEPVASSTGPVSGALAFDGVNDGITWTNVSGINTGNSPFSMEMWIKADAVGATRAWVAQLGGESTGNFHWLYQTNGSTDFGIWFCGSCQTHPALNQGRWTHVMLTSDTSALRLYENGVLTATSNAFFNLTGVPLSLGQQHLGESYFKGSLDEVRLSSTTRSASWINAQYKTMTNTYSSYASEETLSRIWNTYDNPGVASDTTITTPLLTGSNIGGLYSEAFTTGVNPNAATAGQVLEYDFSLDPTSITANTTYFFRLIGSDGTVFDSYSYYPALTFTPDNAPSVSSLGPMAYVNSSWGTDSTPTLTFTTADADVSDTVRYRLQIATTSDFSGLVVDYTSAFGTPGAKSFTVGQALSGGSYAVGSLGQTLADGAAYYWRVLATDNIGLSSSYTTANGGSIAFRIDTVVTSAGSLSLISTTTSIVASISGASDLGVGLTTLPYIFYNTTFGTNSLATSSISWTSLSLVPNTSYTFVVSVSDSNGNTATTSSASIYTTSTAPASTTAVADSDTQITLSWDSNSNPVGTEYYVTNTTASTSSGWITATTTSFSGLTCATNYSFTVKARNHDLVETAEASTTASTNACPTNPGNGGGNGGGNGSPGGGGGAGAPRPSGQGFTVVINNNQVSTQDQWVTLKLNGGPDATKMMVSNRSDFSGATIQDYTHSLSWNICDSTCVNGVYTVYVKFLTLWGVSSPVVSDDITYNYSGATYTPPVPDPLTGLKVGLGASVNRNNWFAPLQGVSAGSRVSLRADLSLQSLNKEKVSYEFDCTSDGIVDRVFKSSNQASVTANNLCTYSNPGVYTAQVTAIYKNMRVANSTYIVVGNPVTPSVVNPPVVVIENPPAATPPEVPTSTPVATIPPTVTEPTSPTPTPAPSETGSGLSSGISEVREIVESIIGAITEVIGGAVGDAVAYTQSFFTIEKIETLSTLVSNTGDSIQRNVKEVGLYVAPDKTTAQAVTGVSAIAIAPTMLTLQYSLAQTGLAHVTSLPDLWLVLTSFINGILTTLGLRTRRRLWGTVYDSKTKQPLDPVVVDLIDAKTGKIVEQSITDMAGRFGFLDRPGTYILRAQKTHYEFPSKTITGPVDGMYANLYYGGTLELLASGSVLAPNIPMDAEAFDWNQMDKKRIVNFHPKIEQFVSYVLHGAFWVGGALTLLLSITHPTVVNIVFALVYAALSVLKHIIPTIKLSGLLVSGGTSLSGVNLELYHKDMLHTAVARALTNQEGRFFLKATPGEYLLKVKQINDSEVEVLSEQMVSIGKDGVLNQVISLK